jgi:hypothetical protein
LHSLFKSNVPVYDSYVPVTVTVLPINHSVDVDIIRTLPTPPPELLLILINLFTLRSLKYYENPYF